MKILVTGGAGFIGSHIVDRYISLGHEVAVVDNLSTGREEFINPGAKFYKVDIRDSKLNDIFKKERPDIVNHHAAQMNVSKSVSDPLYDAQVNILGSLNIIQNSIEYGVVKIIFASSGGAVYGEPRSLPVSETYIKKPTSPYGVSKLCVENYLFAMNTYSSIDYVILRYSNVYGPRQNPQGEAGVCAIFISRMLSGQPCILYGDGNPVRDYVFVQDIVDANILVQNKGSRGIYNLGTGIGTKVIEIYKLLEAIMKIDDKPEYKPLRNGEVEKIYLDCNKAKEELGWAPRIDIREGLEKTAEFFSTPSQDED